MEMQQMIEMLAEMKGDQARMEAKMDPNQAKAAKQEEMQVEISQNDHKSKINGSFYRRNLISRIFPVIERLIIGPEREFDFSH
jgi:hypothetical protein